MNNILLDKLENIKEELDIYKFQYNRLISELCKNIANSKSIKSKSRDELYTIMGKIDDETKFYTQRYIKRSTNGSKR